ncbi:hypothetical protein CC78DRAFT_330525 [Lojkania enalia]|uniref:Uncharacterized protein n=1 Tax=Lojkania enalia TaxID=147567 RepID=A0A9P4KHR2_9PLEO|nr:hypothetical protein CC78DRAFT_330525 [Didymosphaeria enalia]
MSTAKWTVSRIGMPGTLASSRSLSTHRPSWPPSAEMIGVSCTSNHPRAICTRCSTPIRLGSSLWLLQKPNLALEQVSRQSLLPTAGAFSIITTMTSPIPFTKLCLEEDHGKTTLSRTLQTPCSTLAFWRLALTMTTSSTSRPATTLSCHFDT